MCVISDKNNFRFGVYRGVFTIQLRYRGIIIAPDVNNCPEFCQMAHIRRAYESRIMINIAFSNFHCS